MRFKKHYTLEEARALLPQVRKWLSELNTARQRIVHHEKRVSSELASGADLGGESVNDWVRSWVQLQKVLFQFHKREIQIKDLDRGLLDFPAIIGGREVFLCWEQDEDDIEYWHDLDSGYAGREKLQE